jgi:hypothetical protein
MVVQLLETFAADCRSGVLIRIDQETKARMTDLMVKDIRAASMELDYWRDYAFRLEAELGAALHGSDSEIRQERDKLVTEPD